MADLPKPTAVRLERPSWRDARLVVGVLLVLLATAVGAKVVSAAGSTAPMYAAAVPLVPGQQVTQDDVRRVDVRLGGDLAAYVAADHDVAPDTFAVREVRPGELLLRSAVGPRSQVLVKPVTVPVDPTAAAALLAGSVVDVWVNDRDASSVSPRYLKPELALESATVARVPDGNRGLGSVSATVGVQVLVAPDKVQSLIASVDRGAKVTLVPVAGSQLRSAS